VGYTCKRVESSTVEGSRAKARAIKKRQSREMDDIIKKGEGFEGSGGQGAREVGWKLGRGHH
jgi:hypothetical protein